MTITQLRSLGRALGSARVRAALSLGVVATVGITGTFAHWTDTVTVTGTVFTAGRIDLKVSGNDTITGFTALNLTTMVPGNSIAVVVPVSNTGTAPLKYTVVTTATNPDTKNLAAALVVKVTTDTAAGGTAPAKLTCPGTALAGSSTTLNSALIPTGRLLAAAPGAAASESLCVQVTLPASVTNTNLQGGTTSIGFTFTGTSDLS
ncbi:SipW-dependent-type signal peptide-containing protein [Nocardioides sp. cx-169]|uniref:TasA family protein n=1 Tax=Nocardioides sp. cx-169 TaxID=2899080 RepID=UPI001E50AEDE|nr:TasA family protein [Nocardioides sp. cx-169]MCD4535091.1 SipW-dependent-type signal peptide-containing protein [Nocardioides sp. cx-169]